MKTTKILNFPTCSLSVVNINGSFSSATVNWHNRNLVDYTIKTSGEAADFIGAVADLADVFQPYSL